MSKLVYFDSSMNSEVLKYFARKMDVETGSNGFYLDSTASDFENILKKYMTSERIFLGEGGEEELFEVGELNFFDILFLLKVFGSLQKRNIYCTKNYYEYGTGGRWTFALQGTPSPAIIDVEGKKDSSVQKVVINHSFDFMAKIDYDSFDTLNNCIIYYDDVHKSAKLAGMKFIKFDVYRFNYEV